MAAPAVVLGVIGLADKLLDLGSEFIEDPDKKIQYQKEILELTSAFSTKVLETTTVPWVDATVKLMYAARDVLIPMLRPLGSAAITAFGMYAHAKGIEIDPVIHGTLDVAFPGWMASRHAGKTTEAKEVTKRHAATEQRRVRKERLEDIFDSMSPSTQG